MWSQSEKLLEIDWKKCSDLPIAVGAPSVVRIGDCIYVGGGLRRGNEAIIMEYRISQDTWTNLPHCPTTRHSLTTLNDKLVVIGGKISSKATNVVYTFRARDGRWLKDLPPMPTARYSLSTVSHQDRYIIAAGGLICGGEAQTSVHVVEIFIKEKKKWYYCTKILPFPVALYSTCIVNNVCYTVGGVGTPEQSRITFCAPLSTLIRYTVPAKSSVPQITWKQLPRQHPLLCTSPVAVNKRLVAFGGYADVTLPCGTRLICTYDFFSHRWLELADAQLPVPLYRPGVITLDNDKLMIIGGQPKSQQFSPSVFIGSFTWLDAS